MTSCHVDPKRHLKAITTIFPHAASHVTPTQSSLLSGQPVGFPPQPSPSPEDLHVSR